MKKIDKEIVNIEKGDAWNETDEIVQLQARKTLDKVVPVRLPSDVWEKLREEAKNLGFGPTTLARMWILERLNQKTVMEDVVSQTTERMYEEWKRQLDIIIHDRGSEKVHYYDTGCDLSDSCLHCPFTECVYDRPVNNNSLRRDSKATEMVRLVEEEGKSISEVAKIFGISNHIVQKALKAYIRELPQNPDPPLSERQR